VHIAGRGKERLDDIAASDPGLYGHQADGTSREQIGVVTSGGFGPSLNTPVAMGYVPAALAAIGSRLFAEVRSQRLPMQVVALPFVTPTYKR